MVARLFRDKKYIAITPYPFEQGTGVGAMRGGLFQLREGSLIRNMENHSSLRTVSEYESHYVNTAGYWMAFHESALELGQESFDDEKGNYALRNDVRGAI